MIVVIALVDEITGAESDDLIMQIVENNNGCAAFTSCAMTTSYLNTKLKAGSINYHRIYRTSLNILHVYILMTVCMFVNSLVASIILSSLSQLAAGSCLWL